MADNDIEFKVTVDTSSFDQSMSALESRLAKAQGGGSEKFSMADAAYERRVSEGLRQSRIGKTVSASLSEFNADSYGVRWSQAGSDAYTKFMLQQKRTEARRDMRALTSQGDEEGARLAAEKYAFADNALRADRLGKTVGRQDEKQEEITGELKDQNEEYLRQLALIEKMRALLSALKGVWDATLKVVSSVSANIREVTGFGTKDLTAQYNTATDHTRATLVYGLEALGKDAPFSVNALNNATGRIEQERRNAWLNGQVDESYVRSVEWLSSAIGNGFNANDLLGGSNDTSITEVIVDSLRKAEQYLASNQFQNQSQIKKQQDLESMIEVFGEEIVNGLFSNMTINKHTGDNITAVERALSKGTAANTSLEVEASVRKINNELAELADAFKLLKQTITIMFEPFVTWAAKHLTKGVKGLTAWLADGKFESFALDRATRIGLSAPKPIIKGIAWDKALEVFKSDDRNEALNRKDTPLEIPTKGRISDMLAAFYTQAPAGTRMGDFLLGETGYQNAIGMFLGGNLKDARGQSITFHNDMLNEAAHIIREMAQNNGVNPNELSGELIGQILTSSKEFTEWRKKWFGQGMAFDIDPSSNDAILKWFKMLEDLGLDPTGLDSSEMKAIFDIFSATALKNTPNSNVGDRYIEKGTDGKLYIVLETRNLNGTNARVEIDQPMYGTWEAAETMIIEGTQE